MVTAAGAEIGEPPPFLIAYSEGKAYVLITEIPRYSSGFNIYRFIDREWVQLNKRPVMPEKDPLLFRDILGDDYYWVKDALRAENEIQVARRLLGDPGVGFAFSLASLNVARATGRLFVDQVPEGKAKYRIVFLDLRGRELERKEAEVNLREIIPDPPPKPELEPGDGYVRIKWDYPPHSGRPEEATVTFNIYRKKAGEEKFRRINRVRIMRQKGGVVRDDYDVENGVEYTYYITALDFLGRESSPSPVAKVTPKDMTPPLIPEGLTAKSEEGRIVLTWKMNVDVDLSHYNVYRSTEPSENYVKINKKPIPGDRPEFVDSSVRYGVQYFYKVEAVDKSGNRSKMSGAVMAECKDLTPPEPPLDVSYEVKEHKVLLRWKKSKSKDVLGYKVYRSENPERLILIVSAPISADTLYYLDPGYRSRGLIPGRKYYYGVSAVDSAMNESEKATVKVLIPDDEPPLRPLSIYAKSLPDGRIEVRWQPSPSADVALYRVYRSDGRSSCKLVGKTGGNKYRFVDEKVERGIEYFYSVSAVDSAGNEGERTDEFKVISKDSETPPPPSGVAAKVVDKGVEITWVKVEAEDIAGYNVYRSDLPTGVFEKINKEPIKNTKFLDREGRAGYYYKVTSLDTSGNEKRKVKPVKAR